MKKRFSLLILLLCLTEQAFGNPTQFGDTGLLSEPSAETLNAGNICLGLWANTASGQKGDSLIVPVSISMGLGTFLEFYGSYPNLLFNADEDLSGRGFVNLGAKVRFWGRRSSPFKLALDGQARRSISDVPERDGRTDFVGRVIASYKPGRFGLHLNAGYSANEDFGTVLVDDQVIYGGGIEFFPATRLRLIAEMTGATERHPGEDALRESTVGLQYFISPHLTLNLGIGVGLTDSAPDWRGIIGFSTCQGIGTYVKPVPRNVEPVQETAAEPEPAKAAKVRTLTPLIPTLPSARPLPAEPVSEFEIPVNPGEEEVLVYPAEGLVVPESEKQKALPIAPVVSAPNTPLPPAPSTAEGPEAGSRSLSGTSAEPIRTMVFRKFRLPELSFDFDQWHLSRAGKKTLSEIADQLRKEDRWYIIKLEGHTDSVGSRKYNQGLSLKRAEAAGTYLAVHSGFDPSRLFVQGYGEERPLVDNLTPEGRIQNRRIELLVLVPQEGQE